MSYHFTKTIHSTFDQAILHVKDVLKSQGFGVISEIDISSKLKEKLGVDFRKYLILGACSPKHAYQALMLEDKIGTMLPCNVIVQEKEPGQIEVSAVDPIASMMAIGNPGLGEVAITVQAMLRKVIELL